MTSELRYFSMTTKGSGYFVPIELPDGEWVLRRDVDQRIEELETEISIYDWFEENTLKTELGFTDEMIDTGKEKAGSERRDCFKRIKELESDVDKLSDSPWVPIDSLHYDLLPDIKSFRKVIIEFSDGALDAIYPTHLHHIIDMQVDNPGADIAPVKYMPIPVTQDNGD